MVIANRIIGNFTNENFIAHCPKYENAFKTVLPHVQKIMSGSKIKGCLQV